ncbi:hypothetical protein [Flavobacterium sp. GT3R68]|uniref:hypothetical protein n=1 Tax=Flavobacterium sp. GT3R68 TaxID=2594437 RepID=UPI000F86D68A|nr:hypothetical protein [Flavobacterium sp. GT3R68]RTY95289.1 hypothetical protein EKL32_07615 [Flavobacterium sp. GSN2]TRW90970.1 hypothetical protein FNW07_09055 [Flavobacterium sp. GT3R68]
MKKQTGIWIDTSKALIVTLEGGKEKITEIESDIENHIYHEKEGSKGTFSGSHHGSSEHTFDERKKNQMNVYLKDVIAHVKESDELYVFGPAETKTKLEHKIYDEKSFDAGKLKSVQTASSMTPNQIVAKVKQFYK